MKVKSVLAFDIDGTLTKRNSYLIIPNGLTNLLNLLNEKGHLSIPVTGKPTAYANRIIENNNLSDNGVIAENAGVYRRPKDNDIIIYEKNSVKTITALKTTLGIGQHEGGVKKVWIEGKKYEVAVDPEDVSILTIFTNPIYISHRWQFTKTISANDLYHSLNKLITENNWSKDLEVLPPFPDDAIQVIRKNHITGKIIDKSLLPKIINLMFGLLEPVPIAMFGDGHNDIPAMSPLEVIPITFVNSHPAVKEFVEKKHGFITDFPAPEGLGVIQGLYWLANKNFFQSDSVLIKNLILKQFPLLQNALI